MMHQAVDTFRGTIEPSFHIHDDFCGIATTTWRGATPNGTLNGDRAGGICA